LSLSLADVVVVLLALASAARGWRRGLLGQAFELGGGFLGLVAGVAFAPRVASGLTNGNGLDAALVALGVVLVGLSLGQAVGYALGHRFGSFARRARLGGVDSFLGAGFGIGMTLVAYWLIGSLLAQGPFVGLSRELTQSRLLRAMNDVGRPPDVLAYVQQYLNTSGFPLVLPGLPPPAGPPVKLPGRGQATRLERRAQASTVRIAAPRCGGTQLGSGWIAGEGIVVTNAHVVAGPGPVDVDQTRGAELVGEVVLFDPETDVAVIRVSGELNGTALALRRTPVGVGATGVTLGFPGQADGGQRAKPAAVRQRISASGFDIYGRAAAPRTVYVLRARVREGDSGGPFVLPGGRVAGMVFAASTTDRNTGYALTAEEIADEVAAGRTALEPVSTGPCTH
jgi:uncharacterized membrane protein required for colicin V production